MLPPNTVLQDRYLIIRQLGQGGMGTVYEALDQRLNSIVAIKETRLSTEDARRAFEREASLLANLRHRSLPKVIDHFSENDSQCLVMEFIAGDDLAHLLELRGLPFPTADVLRWGDELLRALEYLHGHNPPILHRDIKPSNLKLTREGELFLLDFGLAKGAAGQMPTLLTSRSVKGYTPVYSPLEQIHGGGTDPRSDLYALSATLYQLMTGIAPIDAPTRFLAIDDEQPDPLPTADAVNDEVPHAVAAVLKSGMAMNRRHRPGSAVEMRRLLLEASQATAQADAPQTIASLPALVSNPQAGAGHAMPATVEAGRSTGQPQATITAPPPEFPASNAAGSILSDPLPSRRGRLRAVAIVLTIIALTILLIGSAVVAPGLLSWVKRSFNTNGSSPSPNPPDLSSALHPENTPTPTPTASPSPEVVKVRFRLISMGGSGCSTYAAVKVTLTTKNRTFQATTNGSGFASFINVPCGDVARISAPDMQLTLKRGQSFVVSRTLQCTNNDVYLGSFGDLDGSLVSEREANSCLKGN